MSTITTVEPRGAAAVTAGALGATAAAVGAITGSLPLIAAAVIVVPVVALVLVRPQRGVLVLVALLPFDGLLLLVELPEAAAAWKEVLLGLTLIAAFVTPRARPQQAPLPRWVLPLLGLGAVALLSAVWVGPVQGGVGLKIMFTGMLTAVVLWRAPLDRRERDHLVTILAVVGAIVAAVGLAQQVVGHEWLHELGYAYNSTIRFAGGTMRSWATFNQPFGFAFFLMLVVLVTGSVAMADPWRTRNLAILLATPLLLAGMASALVRSAWIGLAFGVAYLAVARYRRLFAVVPAVIGALAVAAVMSAGAFSAPPSLVERTERWQQLPAITADAPFGQGIGSAGAAAARVELLAGGAPTFDPSKIGASRVVFQPDNAYAKVLYELGIVGFGLFVALLLAVFAATRAAERKTDLGPFAVGASALVVAAAVASLTSTFFEIFPLDYLFWAVVGVVATGAAAGRTRGHALPGGTS